MMKYTITYWERCQEDFEKTQHGHVWGVKYPEKWTSVFCEIGVVFFLISCTLTSNSFYIWS